MLFYQASEINVISHANQDDYNNLDPNYPLFIIFTSNPTAAQWSKLPSGATLLNRWQQQENTDNLNILDIYHSQLPNEQGTKICLINLEKYSSTFARLTTLRKQIVEAAKNTPKEINVLLIDIPTDSEEQILNDFILCAGSYYIKLPKISKENSETYSNPYYLTLNCHGVSKNYNFERTLAEIYGNGLTRFLCNLPANYLYPESYCEYAQELANENNWQYEFLDVATLKQKQAGAYLAVIQGSARPDAGIIKLSYKPQNNKVNKKITLVGKGICFDTGGYNLKTPLGSMYGMNHDMTGSAIALGTLSALSKLNAPFEVEAWLALAQNDIGPDAYKPGDVVYASNGMSIEVINTDAEGRMILCDTLYLASLSKPDLIIDYATLTGSCVRALDQLYSGLVTNQQHWNSKLIEIGQQCGERVWPFPYSEDYDEALKSDIADIKQCHEGSADQIRAARFLGKFIYNNTPWIHIDLSSHAHKNGLGHIHSDVTGFGVRFTLSSLLDSSLLDSNLLTE